MPTRITVYARYEGGWSLYRSEGTTPVEADLADGYMVNGGAYNGRKLIFGPPGTLGLTADRAIAQGVLKLIS